MLVNAKALLPDEKSRAAAISILSNTLLVLLKLVVGLAINSVSVISEAIHSALDLVAAIIAYFSVRTSNRPPDKRHPYGHGKYENASGTVEALLILVAAGWILYEAYQKILHGGEVETVGLGIIVMAVSAITNFFISRKLMSTAKKTDSVALEADGLHLLTDVYTSVGVLLGLLALQITKLQILDPIIAALVALMIIKAAYKLTLRAFLPLLDVAIPHDEEAEIVDILEKLKEEKKIVDYHQLRTRQAGSERYIDMHVVVPNTHSMKEAHRLNELIQGMIVAFISNAEVTIHIDINE